MNMNVQMQSLESVKAYRAAQSGVGVADLAAAGMDPFALIFEQMAMAMGQNPESGLGEGFLPAEGQQKSEDPNDLMMELAGAMLVQNPQWMEFLQLDDASAAELVSGLNLPADVKQFLLDARTAVQNTQSPVESASAFLEAVKENAPVQQSEQSDSAQMDFAQGDAAALTQLVGGEDSAEELPGLADTFLRNIREAKSLLANAPKADTEEPTLDIDQLQSDVMTNRFNPMTSMRMEHVEFNDTEAQAPALDQQIQQGITENLLRGQKEFTIKLRPEGLGEITVKLLEKPGEASVLSLITSSAETAHRINEKLTALQEAMRPLQVQVNVAVPETVEPSEAGSQPDFHSQQFLFDQQQSNGNQKQEQKSGRSGSTFRLTDDGLVEEVAAEQLDGLDTYI